MATNADIAATPYLWALPPGTERYRVAGGGATALTIKAGDKIEITDPQGRQSCELSAFDVNGRSDAGILGASGGGLGGNLENGDFGNGNSRNGNLGNADSNNGIKSILSAPLRDARRVRSGLAQHGIDLQAAKPVSVFAPDSPANTTARFTAHASGALIVAAPGPPMSPHNQDPPTDLVVFIHRATLPEAGEYTLPNPLAEATSEIIIQAATARAYEVAKGDYFQVFDIEGRQCSDFQCFAVSDLENGTHNYLDSTITRSLMGATCPAPGLYSKFYSSEMRPLVEVVQDTVGRHDTFNTACNSRYYEELGYPGHTNCTDNINRIWQPYEVAPKRGWEAINFFYNTNIDDNNQIFFNEPWSRPGDYVLMRALVDLVCVSTACPCDIDAANAWSPTDIGVRVYPAQNMFKKGTAFRMTSDSDPQLTKETGFHPRTSALTNNFSDYEGYWLANSYRDFGATKEYWACRQAASAIDLSPLRKYEVVGPDSEKLLQSCLTRNVRKLSDGQVSYTAMCYETGTMIDDGTIYRLGREQFRWIGGSDASGLWLRRQAEELGLKAWVRESTTQLHNLQVQGPNSRAILEEVIWTRPDQPCISELGWFRFAIARIGDDGGIPLVVSRTGYTGELGYEVFCHPKDAAEVWDAIFAAGDAHGLVPMGLEALDILRIEAGLIFAGQEFCDQTDPYEAGIGFAVALNTEEDFIGKAALIERQAHPQRKLVGLEISGGEPGALDDGVYVGRAQVGSITSGTISPILKKNVALCRLAIQYCDVGTQVEVGKIDGFQKRIPATVVGFPFYDPTKSRVRGLA